MHDSTSTSGPQRPRVRRGLGVLVGAALLVTPLAATPAASAATLSNVTPQGLAAVIAQLGSFLAQILSGLGNVVATPTGCEAPTAQAPGAGYADGLSSTLTTIIAALGAPACDRPAKAAVTATMRKGKVTSIRVR